jgi:hypothetical protein
MSLLVTAEEILNAWGFAILHDVYRRTNRHWVGSDADTSRGVRDEMAIWMYAVGL